MFELEFLAAAAGTEMDRPVAHTGALDWSISANESVGWIRSHSLACTCEIFRASPYRANIHPKYRLVVSRVAISR